MRFLLDTCVLSELVRAEPAPRVVSWIDAQDEGSMCISVVTIGELHKGVARLPDSPKRRKLARWISNDLRDRFRGRIIPVTEEIAETWGTLLGTAENAGNPLPVVDALLAATALSEGLVVVSRNVDHLQRTGAEFVNPWDELPKAAS